MWLHVATLYIMKSVGLRELKNRLGVYMRYVRDGEAVAITDRGKVIAELTPPKSASLSALETLARRGEITLAKPLNKRERASVYARLPHSLRGMTAQDLLDADRSEH